MNKTKQNPITFPFIAHHVVPGNVIQSLVDIVNGQQACRGGPIFHHFVYDGCIVRTASSLAGTRRR